MEYTPDHLDEGNKHLTNYAVNKNIEFDLNIDIPDIGKLNCY